MHNRISAIAIDTETNGSDPRHDPDFKLLGVSYTSDLLAESDYIPVGHYGNGNTSIQDALRTLRYHLDTHNTVVFHHAKFDLLTLQRGLGLDLYSSNWYDTMLMQHFVDENLPNKSLDYLAKHHFNEAKVHDERMKTIINGPGWGYIPIWLMTPYAIQDTVLTLKLFHKLYPLFVEQGFDN